MHFSVALWIGTSSGIAKTGRFSFKAISKSSRRAFQVQSASPSIVSQHSKQSNLEFSNLDLFPIPFFPFFTFFPFSFPSFVFFLHHVLTILIANCPSLPSAGSALWRQSDPWSLSRHHQWLSRLPASLYVPLINICRASWGIGKTLRRKYTVNHIKNLQKSRRKKNLRPHWPAEDTSKPKWKVQRSYGTKRIICWLSSIASKVQAVEVNKLTRSILQVPRICRWKSRNIVEYVSPLCIAISERVRNWKKLPWNIMKLYET